jgi:hypothetical protein
MLKPAAAAIAGAVAYGALVLLVSVANLFIAGYGSAFLEVLASIYPGYEAQSTVAGALLVTVYAVVDGAILGFLVAWVYNRFAG